MSQHGSDANLPADAKARIARYLAREAERALTEQSAVDAKPADDEPR